MSDKLKRRFEIVMVEQRDDGDLEITIKYIAWPGFIPQSMRTVGTHVMVSPLNPRCCENDD